MKRFTLFAVACLALLSFSCSKSPEMLTVINADGSCYREFEANVGEEFMQGDTADNLNPFPVLVDSTCNLTWTYGTGEPSTEFPLTAARCDSLVKAYEKDSITVEKAFKVRLRKNFASVEKMASEFRYKPTFEWYDLKVNLALKTSFRWFYTYYSYTEIYTGVDLHPTVPLDRYVTKEEAGFWFTGSPDLLKGMNGVEIRQYVGDLETRCNRWFNQNLWNASYEVLLNHYASINNPPVDSARFASLRDTLFQQTSKDNFEIDMKKMLDDYFSTHVFTDFWISPNSPMWQFKEEYEEQPFMRYATSSLVNKLLMPGSLLETGQAIAHGDTLVWKLTAERLLLGDYAVNVTSRKANVWAFVLTGFLCLIAIGGILYTPGKGMSFKQRVRKSS